MSLSDFKNMIANEANRATQDRITSMVNYAENGEHELYLLDDVMILLGVKSLRHKLIIVDESDKVNRTVKINNISKFRTLITKKGICKIIASMRRPPNSIICKFFDYSNCIPYQNVAANNVYVQRLRNIFSGTKVETFYELHDSEQHMIIHVFFPIQGIIIIFSKDSDLFDASNISFINREISKKYPDISKLNVIQFAGYDMQNTCMFDELLKDIFRIVLSG